MKGEPDEPYIYQPFGALTNPEHKEADRMYGISGMGFYTDIKGLSKKEAKKLLPVCKQIVEERRSGK